MMHPADQVTRAERRLGEEARSDFETPRRALIHAGRLHSGSIEGGRSAFVVFDDVSSVQGWQTSKAFESPVGDFGREETRSVFVSGGIADSGSPPSVPTEALGSRRESMTWRYEVQHVSTALGMAQAGMGLTVVPRLGIDLADDSGLAAVTLGNPGIARTIKLLTRRGQALSPAAESLARVVQARLREL